MASCDTSLELIVFSEQFFSQFLDYLALSWTYYNKSKYLPRQNSVSNSNIHCHHCQRTVAFSSKAARNTSQKKRGQVMDVVVCTTSLM